MLYDPKWEQQTKANPLTLPALIAWLETKDPNETYDFNNCDGACLYDQYVGRCTKYAEYCEIADAFIAQGFFASEHPRTFGGALSRARSALA